MIIEGSQATFEIAVQDNVTMTSYMGPFKVKCFLTPLETIRADRIYRELIGPVNSVMAADQARTYAFAISQLAVRVINSPDFFKNPEQPDLAGGHLPESVLIKILDMAIDAESEFRDQQKKKFEETQKRLVKKYKSNKIKKRVEAEDEEEPVEEEESDE